MKNLIKKILKESEREWFEDIEPLIPTKVKVDNGYPYQKRGKRFAIEGNEEYSDFKPTGWNGWYRVTGTVMYNGEECYIVYFGYSFPRVYMPIKDFGEKDVRFY